MKEVVLKLTMDTKEETLEVGMINDTAIVLAGMHSALDKLAKINHTSTLNLLSIMLETELEYIEKH